MVLLLLLLLLLLLCRHAGAGAPFLVMHRGGWQTARWQNAAERYGAVSLIHASCLPCPYAEGVFIRIYSALPITLAHWRGYPARLSQA